ncbi:spermidine/putrescine-binding protein [Bradyrhizobium sp. LB7.1]
MSTVTYPQMHASGMFVPIDYTLWDQESLAGVPSRARLEDAVVLYSTSTVLAYDERVFPKGGPKNWADFWDVKRFPGPRGLGTLNSWRTISCALAAAGIPPDHIWPLTDDKLDRAFEKLDEIKPHITKWWTAGGEPPQLLINREYAMTSAYDGRVLSSVRQGAPIKFVWEHAVLALSPVGVILKGGPNTANAQKLLAFWNRAQIAAAFTQAVGYPAPNTNQLKYLPPDLIPLLSVNPQNASKTIIEDFNWLAAKRSDGKSNLEYIQEQWLKWRSG